MIIMILSLAELRLGTSRPIFSGYGLRTLALVTYGKRQQCKLSS